MRGWSLDERVSVAVLLTNVDALLGDKAIVVSTR
jgi:hypothetical protein